MVTERWYEQDINKPIQVQHCEGVVFTADNLGNTIGVKLFNNGSAYSPGGTVSCNIIRSDGITVNVNGTITGNSLSVTLPIDALTVPGRIAVVIQSVNGSVVTTVFKGIYTVELSSTDTIVAPSVSVSSLAELTANKVSKSGDTMTGNLYFKTGSGYPTIGMFRDDNSRAIWIQPNITGDAKLTIYEYNTAGTYYERYDLPTINASLAANVGYDILTTKQPITKPANGGHATTSVGGYVQMGKVVVVTMTVVIDTSISEYSIVADSMPESVGMPVLQGYDTSYNAKAFKLDSGKLYALGGASAGTYYINGTYLTA